MTMGGIGSASNGADRIGRRGASNGALNGAGRAAEARGEVQPRVARLLVCVRGCVVAPSLHEQVLDTPALQVACGAKQA